MQFVVPLHKNDPANVYRQKGQNFDLKTPAGRDIKVRATGNSRDQKAVAFPYCLNILSEISRSFLLNKCHFSKNRNALSPYLYPIPYDTAEPAKFPKAPIKTTSPKLKTPLAAKNPEKGIITSEGMGIFALSKNINKKTEIYSTEIKKFLATGLAPEKIAVMYRHNSDRVELRPMKQVSEKLFPALVSEEVLAKEWNTKEEDEAWKDL